MKRDNYFNQHGSIKLVLAGPRRAQHFPALGSAGELAEMQGIRLLYESPACTGFARPMSPSSRTVDVEARVVPDSTMCLGYSRPLLEGSR